MSESLALINAIETLNRSPMLADINITLGYRILDTCSDVSTALRAVDVLTQQTSCRHTAESTCVRPATAIIGASHSEISIAVARQLTLRMIPQVRL